MISQGREPHTFSCVDPMTITIGAEIVIDTNVKLDGESRVTLSGAGTHRIFSIDEDLAGVELHDLAVTGGSAKFGGGIRIGPSAIAILRNVDVSGNEAVRGGGGIYINEEAKAVDGG